MLVIDEATLIQKQHLEHMLLLTPADNSIFYVAINEELGNETDLLMQYDVAMGPVVTACNKLLYTG